MLREQSVDAGENLRGLAAHIVFYIGGNLSGEV